jgi:OOP family OmpA-OmpF porin
MTRIASRTRNRTRALPLLALAGLSPLMALPAQAQEGPKPYFGLAAGRSQSHLGTQAAADNALGGLSTATGLVADKRFNGYRVFGGLQMSRFWALEASYFDLGNFTFESGTTAGDTLSGKLKLQGGALDVVGTVPLTERLSLLGRIGGTYAKSRYAFGGTAPVVNGTPSKRQANLKSGVGLQYAFTDNFQMRGEYERYRMNNTVGRGNVDLVTVSVVFPFGGPSGMRRTGSRDNTAPPMAQAAPEPMAEPMAAAPAEPQQAVAAPEAPTPMTPAPAIVAAEPTPPAPEVAAAPQPPVVAQRSDVTYSAESLFGFDAATVQPEGKAQLDTFVRDLKGTEFETVTVDGYADRLGDTPYNQDLSQRRADAVKSYLVTQGRIDPSKIKAVGHAETMPMTLPTDCVGAKATPQLVICLQPDRRVEIDVQGKR